MKKRITEYLIIILLITLIIPSNAYADDKGDLSAETMENGNTNNNETETESGSPCTDKVVINEGKKYLVSENGSFRSGWYIPNSKYKMYFSPVTKEAVTGLVKIKDKRYLFDSKGRCRTSEGVRGYNGKKYYSRSNGSLRSGWVRKPEYTMYFSDRTYAAQTGIKRINGKYYIFRKNGKLVRKEGTVLYKGKKYWIGKGGALKSGWLVTPRYKLYFKRKDHTAYVNTTKSLGNKKYTFDENGAVSAEGRLFWKSKFGITRKKVVDYLNSNMDLFIGTPYGGGAEDTAIPGVMMQCSGFVWYVLNETATRNHHMLPCSDIRRCSRYYSPTWDEMLRNFGLAQVFGGASDALGWSGQKYVFADKASMLRSGVLEKGDIIWIAGSDDTHLGFFWGNTPYQDRYWHSKYYGHETTRVYKGQASGNRISKIEACGSPMAGGYVVYKLD